MKLASILPSRDISRLKANLEQREQNEARFDSAESRHQSVENQLISRLKAN